MKSNRAAMKRFKVTGTGKVKREKAYRSHILTKKSQKRKTSTPSGSGPAALLVRGQVPGSTPNTYTDETLCLQNIVRPHTAGNGIQHHHHKRAAHAES